ncbi:unnamed protein product, partial [Mesorhabditis spiculigera]
MASEPTAKTDTDWKAKPMQVYWYDSPGCSGKFTQMIEPETPTTATPRHPYSPLSPDSARDAKRPVLATPNATPRFSVKPRAPRRSLRAASMQNQEPSQQAPPQKVPPSPGMLFFSPKSQDIWKEQFGEKANDPCKENQPAKKKAKPEPGDPDYDSFDDE